MEPAPEWRQGMTWMEFLKTHWDVLAATDFFTVELWTAKGLIHYHVLFVIRLATREVQIAGLVPEPNEAWMEQITRKLVDPLRAFCMARVALFTIVPVCSVISSVNGCGIAVSHACAFAPGRLCVN